MITTDSFKVSDERTVRCEWCDVWITVPNAEGPWVCGDCVARREKENKQEVQEDVHQS